MGNVESRDFLLVDEKYGDGVATNEYNGQWALVKAKQKPDGDIWMEWVYPAKKNEPGEKRLPWKIPLGDRESASATLRLLADMIEGIRQPGEDDSDINF